eukprot:gene13406-4271_t
MSGCLDGIHCPHIEIDCGEKRNQIASVVAGGEFQMLAALVINENQNVSVWQYGWWFAIDTAANDPLTNKTFHLCGVASTIALFMVNAVSNAQVRGDSYEAGCLGQTGARIWLLIGFIMGFGGLIGACWVLFGAYVVTGVPDPWPGVAIFLQNSFIFFSFISKFIECVSLYVGDQGWLVLLSWFFDLQQPLSSAVYFFKGATTVSQIRWRRNK